MQVRRNFQDSVLSFYHVGSLNRLGDKHLLSHNRPPLNKFFKELITENMLTCDSDTSKLGGQSPVALLLDRGV